MKKCVLAVLVALAFVAIPDGDSYAFFGRRHGCCGFSAGGCRGAWRCGGGWNDCRGCFGRCGGWQGCYGCFGAWGCSGGCGGCNISYGPHGCFAQVGVGHGHIAAVSQPSRYTIASSATIVKTSLTLHVPADAKVTLAGVATEQTGATRTFATSKLRAGEPWNDYKVVVELQSAEQTFREERTIKLIGGRSQELTVNFDNTQLAQR